MKWYFLFTVIPLLLVGCDKEKYESAPHGYYTLEYVNFAWGAQYNGWIMNEDGNIMSFNLPTNWNRLDSLGYISEADLLDNLAQCDETTNKVSQRELNKHNILVEGASTGTFSERKSTARDAGAKQYSCYHYDEELDLYKKVTLSVEGDWSFHNQSTEAKKITKWMQELDQR